MSRQARPMDGIEIGDCLGANGTGVLGLANGGDSYAIPLSFAYDDGAAAVFFRMGYAPGSQKRAFVDSTDSATFVVYAESDGVWRSVVAQGPLAEVSKSNLDSSVVETVNALNIPFFQVHERPQEDLEIRIVRLSIRQVRGMVSG